MAGDWVTVLPKIPGISTEPLSNKTEFGVVGREKSLAVWGGERSHCFCVWPDIQLSYLVNTSAITVS